ncbi:apurinic/apyrimidinic endonuclease Apn1, putative [Plasmodium gallinaceum]|uniref:Apurinic/apyrimidinic endonuclease Apn1, putative n=1 Tax=Plasmodium gallinaceum TaxID=5849 RepID=A0A1J1GRB2_PLAGA|nr:apurinic/apyrimidinic endonuclease Apn1, putative [Plasmodium gallinaceum]CRG95049.1 apurinic/apyrimidinic endonuclease Apn1, putative [Plasmodium gallinaceum]
MVFKLFIYFFLYMIRINLFKHNLYALSYKIINKYKYSNINKCIHLEKTPFEKYYSINYKNIRNNKIIEKKEEKFFSRNFYLKTPKEIDIDKKLRETSMEEKNKSDEKNNTKLKKEVSEHVNDMNVINTKKENVEEIKKTVKTEKNNVSEKVVTKKKIDKKGIKKKKLEISTSKVSYPPIPSSLEKKWDDFKKIKEYAKKTNVYLGAHISASGGVQNAPVNSFNISGLSFALFLKNQRKWESASLTSDNINKFEENCKKYEYDKNFILPHGSYLINLANPDKEKREKSYLSFLDDIKRCEQLKIKMYNFHPGSTVGLCSIQEGIKNISDCINRVHKETSDVIIVLENSAGQKNSIGSKFEHLRDIINQVNDKSRIGVCLDTCHTLAAGYDIKSFENFEKVMKQFDEIVNTKYLKAVHLNDSKSDIGSGLDRHENIGKGKLTIDTFKYIMTSDYFKNMPIILETPDVTNDESVYKYEIEYLYKLCLT